MEDQNATQVPPANPAPPVGTPPVVEIVPPQTDPQQTPPSGKFSLSPKIMLIILAILIVAVVGSGIYLSAGTQPKPTPTPTPSPTLKPTPISEGLRPDNFSLATTWQNGTKTYQNSRLDLIFQYPKSFMVRVQNTYSYSSSVSSSFALELRTPDVPIEKRREQGFDFKSYDDNTMSIAIEKFDNDTNLTLDNFLADIYAKPGIDGKTPVIKTLRQNLQSSDIPKPASYVYTGDLSENPVKAYYFTDKKKIYVFRLYGGNNTGEGYSKDAEAIFDNIIKSVLFK